MLNFYLPRNFFNTEIGGVDEACKKKGTSMYCSGYLIELLTILYSVTVYNMLIWCSDNEQFTRLQTSFVVLDS